MTPTVDMRDPKLVELQKELEVSSIDRGVDNYYKNIEGRKPSELTPERRYIARGMDALVPVIKEEQRRWAEGEPVRNAHIWGKYLGGIDPAKIAFCTLSSLYNNADSFHKHTHLCGLVGADINDLRVFESIRQMDNEYFYKVMNHTKKMTPYRLRMMKKNFQDPLPRMSQRDRILIGAYMTGYAVNSTGMFDFELVPSGGNLVYRTRLKPEVREEIDRMREHASLARPRNFPMVVPPLDWTNEEDGGYYINKYPLVKNIIGTNPDQLRESRDGQMGSLINSVNTLHKTKWTVNKTIVDLVETMFSSGLELAKLPGSVRKKKPPLPPNFDECKEARKQWMAEASKINAYNATLEGKTKLVGSYISMARSMLELQEKYEQSHGLDGFWFCWDADFRYRLYPKSDGVHPQSSDAGRAMLRFAEGVPLGEHGFYWMTVGLANYLGYDKTPFDDRYNYILKKEDEIRKWVEDPLRNRGWTEADKPFMALATAMEWVEAIHDRKNYVSHVPIGVDGTCNGLQHYAALSRDQSAAKYTNLTVTEDPESLYYVIVDSVNETIEADCRVTPTKDADGDVAPCHAWRGKVTKDTVKVSVMTTPYGVTNFGIMDHIHESLDEDELEGHSSKNMVYMMNCIQLAMREVMFASSELMDWLRTAATACVKADKDVIWTNVLGMPVRQVYPNFAQSRIYTPFSCITWKNPERLNEKDPRSMHKNQNSLPPNFVHNIDMAHMAMTIDKAVGVGVQSFSMVHDEYKTHAGHMANFKPLINEAFVELHSQPIMENFKRDIEELVGKELPPLPDTGTYDINEALKSPYLFS